MKNSWQLIGALAVLIGFGLGVVVGQWRERLRVDVLDFSEAVGRSFFLSQHADLQDRKADYDAAHEALSAWLSHLEETRPVDGKYRDPLMTDRGIAIDKALTLGRLALLEERRGRHDLGKDYWARAEREAGTAAWKDATQQGIRAVVQRVDNCESRAQTP